MRSAVVAAIVVPVLMACSRAQVTPSDRSLPQPDRGPCPKSPSPLLNILLPEPLDFVEVGSRCCDPLDEAVAAAKLGSVEGPSMLAVGDQTWLACTVSASDTDGALGLVKGKLRALGAPKRAVIEELCEGVGSVHSVW